MAIHQARTEAIQEEMKAKMNINREKMEAVMRSDQKEMKATINTIRAELEETIKNWMKYILAFVDQQTQGLPEELNKIKETMARTVSNDIHQYVNWEPQGQYDGHKGPSQRAQPQDPGQDTSNEDPGRVHAAWT
jgi:hypothetical protein